MTKLIEKFNYGRLACMVSIDAAQEGDRDVELIVNLFGEKTKYLGMYSKVAGLDFGDGQIISPDLHEKCEEVVSEMVEKLDEEAET